MPNVFAIQGKGACGKSTSIRNLHTLLLTVGFQSRLNPSPTGDFTDVLDGISPTTGAHIVVGLNSAGDTANQVNQGLQVLLPAGCDTILCACRTSGAGVVAIQTTPGLTVSYIGKGWSSTVHRTVVDAAFANFLFALI